MATEQMEQTVQSSVPSQEELKKIYSKDVGSHSVATHPKSADFRPPKLPFSAKKGAVKCLKKALKRRYRLFFTQNSGNRENHENR